MRKVLVVLLFISAIKLNAQSPIQKNEICVNLMSLEPTHYGHPYISVQPLTGIIYTRHFNAFSIRTGLEYFDYYYDNSNIPTDFFTTEAKKSFDFFSGIQKQFFKKKFRLNSGLDLMYYYQQIKYSEAGGITGNYHKFEYTYNKFLISPNIGFEYILGPHLSVSTESSVEYGFVYREDMDLDSGFLLDDADYYLLDVLKLNIHF